MLSLNAAPPALNAGLMTVTSPMTAPTPLLERDRPSPSLDTLNLGGISAIVAPVAMGGLSGGLFATKVAKACKSGAGGVAGAAVKGGVLGKLQMALPSLAKGTAIGAAVSGLLSAGIYGLRASRGLMTGREAVGEVVADTVSGGLSSLGGLAVSASLVAMAGTALTGLPLALLTVGGGLVGAMAVDAVLLATGLRTSLRDAVAGNPGH